MGENEEQRCKNCRYWRSMPSRYEGLCHLLPPVQVLSSIGPTMSFPVTHPDAWCGQWNARGEKEKCDVI